MLSSVFVLLSYLAPLHLDTRSAHEDRADTSVLHSETYHADKREPSSRLFRSCLQCCTIVRPRLPL